LFPFSLVHKLRQPHHSVNSPFGRTTDRCSFSIASEPEPLWR
jgi:hypothetical protein